MLQRYIDHRSVHSFPSTVTDVDAVILKSNIADPLDNLRAGMSPQEARRQALIKLGGVAQIRELHREQRGLPMLETLLQDLRFGLRTLRNNPGFTFIASLSLALGIGANTAIFSLLDALLLKPLPVKQPEQLVVVATNAAGLNGPIFFFSYPIFSELREKNSVFAGMFAYVAMPMSMSEGGQAERVVGELVSGDFFTALSVGPHLGRVLSDADDQTPGASPVAVISYQFWQRRFAADPQVVGKTINLNGFPFTVIGVAAQGFYGVTVGAVPDVRVPIMMAGKIAPGATLIENRGAARLNVMARLKRGVSLAQAQAATDIAFQIIRAPDVRRVKGDSPDARIFKSLHIHLDSAKTGASSLSRQFEQPLIVLLCLVGVALLIACLNVANLLLARATLRQKEIAVRLALGAGRFRLVRQLLTEGLLLSASGGALGWLFARWGTGVLLGFLPQGRVPTALEIKPDLRMLSFTLGVTLLTGLLFGLSPALQATRPNLIPALKNESLTIGSDSHRWDLRRLLVILQVALSLALLVGAGLFARSLRNLRAVDVGYNADQVITLALDPAQSGYKPEQARTFYDQLSERVAAMPGVKTVSYTRNVPLSGGYSRIGIAVTGYQPRPDEEMAALFNQISSQFFATFGALLLKGRDFNAQDTPESPKVVIVNDRLARYFFGAENPLGRRITLENDKDLEMVAWLQTLSIATSKKLRHRPLTSPFPKTTR